MKKEEIEDKLNIKEIYGKACMQKPEEFLKENEVDKENGLSMQQAKQRQLNYGKNQIKQAKPKRGYQYFLESLLSPFNLILLGITLVLIYTDIFLQPEPSYANIIVVVALVFISTFLEFFEVYKSNKAAEKLKKMVAVKVTVLREGKAEKIFLDEVTIGDVICSAIIFNRRIRGSKEVRNYRK